MVDCHRFQNSSSLERSSDCLKMERKWDEVQHTEDPRAVSTDPEEQLVLQGEEIETREKTEGLFLAARKHWVIILYAVAAYSCAAAYGYDTIASGGTLALPSFELYFGNYDPVTKRLYLDSVWTSLWSSMSGLGQAVGSIAAGPISQRFGRRYASIVFGCITTVGVALQFVATSKELLLVGKIVNGVAVGALLAVGTTYASEISPPRIRGTLLAGLAFFAVAMQCAGLGVVRSFVTNLKPIAFRTALGLQWLVGGIPIILFLFVPESPNWLLLRGRRTHARRSIIRLYGESSSPDARLAHLQSGINHELHRSTHASYVDCFKSTDRIRTLTVCLLYFGNGLIGSAFLTQNIYFLSIAGLPVIHSFDINIGGFALALLIIPCSWYFGDRIGRRPLYLVGVAGNAIGMAVVGALAYVNSSGAIWAIAVLLNLLITWQLFTCFMVSWSMAPELSSYKLRQQTQSIGFIVQALTSWVFLFVTPYMYNVDAGDLGARTGFVFSGSSVLLGALAWRWVPETRGLTTEEIDWLYERGVCAKDFGQVQLQCLGRNGNGHGNGNGKTGRLDILTSRSSKVEVGSGLVLKGQEGVEVIPT